MLLSTERAEPTSTKSTLPGHRIFSAIMTTHMIPHKMRNGKSDKGVCFSPAAASLQILPHWVFIERWPSVSCRRPLKGLTLLCTLCGCLLSIYHLSSSTYAFATSVAKFYENRDFMGGHGFSTEHVPTRTQDAPSLVQDGYDSKLPLLTTEEADEEAGVADSQTLTLTADGSDDIESAAPQGKLNVVHRQGRKKGAPMKKPPQRMRPASDNKRFVYRMAALHLLFLAIIIGCGIINKHLRKSMKKGISSDTEALRERIIELSEELKSVLDQARQ